MHSRKRFVAEDVVTGGALKKEWTEKWLLFVLIYSDVSFAD
jgi:hypothetical protein